MNPEELQPQQSTGPTADQSAAALSFATMLSEGMMPKAPMEEPQDTPQDGSETPQDAPQSTEEPQEPEQPTEPEAEPEEPKENEQITTLTKDVAELSGKMEGMITAKFDELTKTITDALK